MKKLPCCFGFGRRRRGIDSEVVRSGNRIKTNIKDQVLCSMPRDDDGYHENRKKATKTTTTKSYFH